MTQQSFGNSPGLDSKSIDKNAPQKLRKPPQVLPFQTFLEEHRAAIAKDWDQASYSAVADCCLQHEESAAHASRWKRFASEAEKLEHLGDVKP